MMQLRHRWASAIAMLLVVSACSSDGDSAEGDDAATAPTPGIESSPGGAALRSSLDLDAAVAALDDPTTAASGIIGILDHLGIGVYTIEGQQVLPGSETSVDDLWMPAEAIDGLARSARRRSGTFSAYHRGITAWAGVDTTEAELAFMYQDMVSTLPDHPMSQVLIALDAVPEASKPISPFEQWLLLVVLVTPNGEVPPRPDVQADAAGRAPNAIAAPMPVSFASSHCNFAGDNTGPDYDLGKAYMGNAVGAAQGALVDELASEVTKGVAPYGSGVKTAADLFKGLGKVLGWAGKIIDFAKLSAILGNVELEISLDKPSTHRVHDRHGDTREKQRIEVAASVTWLGQPDPPDDVSCDDGWDLGLPPPGRMKNAGVRLTLDDFLIEQGWIRRKGDENTARQLTGENGEVVVWYEPKDEEPDAAQTLGDAFVQKGTGEIFAEFDLVSAFGEFFNAFASLEIIADLFDVMKISTPIVVERHDPAVTLFEIRPIDNGLMTGESVFELSTCDGVTWSGSHEFFMAGDVAGGTLRLTGNTPLEFELQTGATAAETTLSGTSSLVGDVSGAFISDEITTSGTATLEINPETGFGTVTLKITGGGQSIDIIAPPGAVSGGGGVDATDTVFNLPLAPNGSCGE